MDDPIMRQQMPAIKKEHNENCRSHKKNLPPWRKMQCKKNSGETGTNASPKAV